jgi:hypothetical protein
MIFLVIFSKVFIDLVGKQNFLNYQITAQSNEKTQNKEKITKNIFKKVTNSSKNQ